MEKTSIWLCYLFLSASFYQIYTFNISKILDMYVSACGKQLCDQSKNISHGYQLLYNTSVNLGVCPSCECDLDCVTRGDCCPDLFFSLHLSCTETKLLHKKYNKPDAPLFIMVGTCNGTESERTRQCDSVFSPRDHLQNGPVTSRKTGLTYRNKHCSKCLNESIADLIPWRLEIDCLNFADFNFLSSYSEIISLATEQECNIFYIASDSIKQPRNCSTVNEAPGFVNKCNITGTWRNYDSSLEYACHHYDNRYKLFRNIFCFMCNPPEPTTLISECNVTGYWDSYHVDLLEACLRTPKSGITTPFKNYYCYLCNRNSTIGSSKYLDAKMNISEMMSDRYFKLEFHIEALDIRFIKEKIINDIHIQDEFEKEKSRKFTMNTKTEVQSEKNIKMYNTLNLTNIHRKYYAMMGTGYLCDRQSTQKSMNACDCDDNCYFKSKPCCIDKMFERSTACTDIGLSSTGDRFLVYNKCKNTSNIEINRLCQSSSERSLYSSLPIEVSVRNFSVHYKNVFCMLCNEDISPHELQKSIMYWSVAVFCDEYISPTYHVSFQDYITHAIRRKCRYSMKPIKQGTKCSKYLSYDKCNITGYWINNDPDIKYACAVLNLPLIWFNGENPFCRMCNPSNHNNVIYTTCNETQLHNVHTTNDVEKCHELPSIQALAPYKNYFCHVCITGTGITFIWLQSPQVTPSITEPTGIIGPLPKSFREIFALEVFDDLQDNKIEKICNKTQIFDEHKHECRDIICYPGRILTNNGCVPLLPFTSNLGYILSLTLRAKATSTINKTTQFLDTVENSFFIFLQTYLNVNGLLRGSSALHVNLRCSTTLIEGTFIDITLDQKIFINETVDRSLIEKQIINLTHSTFSILYSNVLFEFSIKQYRKLHNFPGRTKRFNSAETCGYERFRTITNAHWYTYSEVSGLLVCEQVEIDDSEFQIDKDNKTLILNISESMKHYGNEYILMSDKKARLCLKDYKDIFASQPDFENPEITLLGILMTSCTLLSLMCLFLTFIAYCLFSTLRSLPGNNNMCLVFAMFFAHLLFQFGLYATQSNSICILIGIFMHMFWLAEFGCLSVCSFHMFRVFRSKILLYSSGQSGYNKVLFSYVLYSYGLPVLIVSINMITTFLHDGSFGYGGRMCFLNRPTAIIVTFIIPITLVCLTNIYFFIVTSVKIVSTPKMKREEQNSTLNRVHFSFYIKLFTITGITWIFQIIDALFPASAISSVVSMLNALQGVFIFISFICNRRVLQLFRKANPLSLLSSTSNTTRGNRIDTTTTSLIDASKTEVDVHVKTEALMSAK
ncbi:uncharacterized protein LOC134720991 [Mytilus trossulus]|uniref:uncharacterized protein LOC134720991 n=1 Tax=Mytilus trossulus TaxID=6551 RepID=UPI0030068B4B